MRAACLISVEKELIRRYVRGEASFEERKQVTDWASDPQHFKELEQERRLFLALTLHLPEAVEAAGDRAARKPDSLLRGRSVPWRRVARMALQAAAVIAVGLVVGLSLYSRKMESLSGQMLSIQTPAGQRMNTTLADGTQVWLNSSARVEYPVLFGRDERRVKVSGEVMFDVAKDSDRPFVVETYACDIEVLGTKFNVVADEANGRFSTALLRGRVRITSRMDGQQILMEPDDVVSLEEGKLRLSHIDDHDEYLWPEGYISLKNKNFNDLVEEFGRVFGARIEVEGTIRGADRRYQWGKIRISDGIDDALEILQASYRFTYTRNVETNEIVIR